MKHKVGVRDAEDRLDAIVKREGKAAAPQHAEPQAVVERLFRNGTRSFEMLDRWLALWVVGVIAEQEPDVQSAWIHEGPGWDGRFDAARMGCD